MDRRNETKRGVRRGKEGERGMRKSSAYQRLVLSYGYESLLRTRMPRRG